MKPNKAKNLLEVERAGTSVVLNNSVGLVGDLEVRVGEKVGASLVAARGNRLRDGEGETLGTADDVESAGGEGAGALLDIGESAVGVAGDKSGAVDTGGLHGTGLDDSKSVTRRLSACVRGCCRVIKTYEHWVLWGMQSAPKLVTLKVTSRLLMAAAAATEAEARRVANCILKVVVLVLDW